MNSEVILSRHTYCVLGNLFVLRAISKEQLHSYPLPRVGCDTVITSILFLFKDLGLSFPGLELPTIHMNGKRSTNWTLAVIYALRTTKPVHKYHRIYKNQAREKSTQNNLTSHHGRDWQYKCKIVIYMHVLQSLYAPIWLPDTYARHRSSWTTVLDEL